MTARTIALALLGMSGLCGCASVPGTTSLLGGTAPVNAASEPRTDDLDNLTRLARDVEANNGGETAYALYRQAVVASGETPESYVRLGDAYLRGGRLKEAVAAYRSALAKNADDAGAQLGLGTALVQQGTLEQGLAALAKAAPRVNTGTAYNRLGIAQTMAGRFAQAEESFETGLKVDEEDPDIATNLALATALAGDGERAATLADEISRMPGLSTVHRRNLVIVFGLIGKSADDARALAPVDISSAEFDALFARAASIRRLSDPKARAHALGTTMQS